MDAELPAIDLVLQSGPTAGQRFSVKDRLQTIGRGSSNNIVIADQSLSRLHARIRPTPHGYVVEDLGSTNGTFINGKRVIRSAPVRPGDTIRLGKTITVKVLLSPPAAGSKLDEEKTFVATAVPGAVASGHAAAPDSTYVPGGSPARMDQTVVPGVPVAPVYPQQQSIGTWLWVLVAVLVVALIIGGILGYVYYSRVLQTPSPGEIARPPTPTLTETTEPTATPTSEPTATPQPLIVPGIPAASAQEQAPPANLVNRVDPFCNADVEVSAEEPVYINWERRLAEADDETDYLAEWLASVFYDITLDGRPISTFNYYRPEGASLSWWANLGTLQPGTHFLNIRWYTSRQISNGLDLEPADGQVDVFGPGPAGEGFCEIVVPEPIAAATATATPTSTFTPESEATPTPTKAAVSQSPGPAPLGVFQDFESPSTWKRGDQPYGEFARSSAQAHSGNYSGQLSYNFPTPDNDYVVFLQSRPLAGQPNAISAWVYGDRSGHFLNLWLKDANGQSWAMSFGRVTHTGWQEMTAYIDPSQPWPSGHISGPDNGVIDYPISFQALVLDDGSDSYTGSGVIYIDDLNSQEGTIPPASAPPGPQVGGPTQVPAPLGGPYVLSVGKHIYEPWGAPYGDLCEALRSNNFNDKVHMRGFNIELLLTNNSMIPVADNWRPVFITAQGQAVQVCDNSYYPGNGPQPGATSSVTFYTQVNPDDYVRIVQLTVNGQFIQLCLGPSGAPAPCQ